MPKDIKIDERGRQQVPAWYGIAITTNKEKVVRGKIEALAKMDKWKNEIFECILPSYTEVNDKGKEIEKLFYTQIGYVHMILNTDTWNAIEMLRGVGFRAILPAGAAQPITEQEMEKVFEMIGREKKEESVFLHNTKEFEVDDKIQVTDKDEMFFEQEGTIIEVFDSEKEALIVLDMIGDETKVRISFDKISKMD